MTEPLDPEVKRLRALKHGELADEVGALKAAIAALDTKLEACKAEGIRRGLAEANGALFRLTFTPPGIRKFIDGALVRAVMGDPFADHFSKTAATEWIMRCAARKAA
jgi:hypothetical protein